MTVQVLPKSINAIEYPELHRMYHEVVDHPDMIDTFYRFIENCLILQESMYLYDETHKQLVDEENSFRVMFEQMQGPLLIKVDNFNKWVEEVHSPAAQNHAIAGRELAEKRREYQGGSRIPDTARDTSLN